MRIIHTIPAVSEEASGATYAVLRLCESLLNEQHQLELAALDWEPLSKEIPFLRTFPLGFGPRRLGRSPAMSQWLRRGCREGKVDVLHNHGMWQMNSIYPAVAARNCNVQLVYSPHGSLSEWSMRSGSNMKKIFWPLLQRPALGWASCFHATAESEYEDLRRLGFRQPVAIIPNGIDAPNIPTDSRASNRTLLFLSRIHRVKGLENLLYAWRALQATHMQWQLVIAGSDDGYHGSGGYLEEIKGLALRLGLQRVSFSGAVFGEQKLQAYRDAELFVLPTYSENFGLVVAEALVMGTPAIVSKGAPWAALQEHGAGWWIDVGIEPLQACLQEAFARTTKELAAMGERGRLWMQRDFSWGSVGARMSATYRWLCNRSLPVPAWVRLD